MSSAASATSKPQIAREEPSTPPPPPTTTTTIKSRSAQQTSSHPPATATKSSKPAVVGVDGTDYHIPPQGLTEEFVADLSSGMERGEFVRKYGLRRYDS